METHGFREVVWTDTDVVWLRDPRPFFALHPTADVAIQTDCLSHVVEANYSGPSRHGFARCGHLPGNHFNNAFNTGMILLRDRPPTHAFLRAWLDYLLDANKMYVDLGGGNKAVVGDQLAFNTLMTRNALPWESVDGERDWRVVWAHDRTVKVCVRCCLAFGARTFQRQPVFLPPSCVCTRRTRSFACCSREVRSTAHDWIRAMGRHARSRDTLDIAPCSSCRCLRSSSPVATPTLSSTRLPSSTRRPSTRTRASYRATCPARWRVSKSTACGRWRRTPTTRRATTSRMRTRCRRSYASSRRAPAGCAPRGPPVHVSPQRAQHTCRASARVQSVPDLYKHMLAVSYQMQVIVEAAAMAAALGRTVVFPRFYCWCDFDWYAVVLDGCAMGGRPGRNGADLFSMPFECPIDVILNPHNLYHTGFAYRQARWLEHPRLPRAVRNSREGVLVVDARDEAALAYRAQMVRLIPP